jgi:hypothetical protein
VEYSTSFSQFGVGSFKNGLAFQLGGGAPVGTWAGYG